MSWPTRYDDEYSYRACTDCGIKRLFDPKSFRSYGPFGYDLHELIAKHRAWRMRQQKHKLTA
jgi:DNA-directed RNA polymerase subunit RPC12/RpoP